MSDVTRSVVVVSGDPGGAAALAPVLARLRRERRIVPKVLAYREAIAIWGREDLPFDELSDATSEDAAARILATSGAKALLVSTSVNTVDLEKRFVAAARRVGVPSIAVLDFWSNYVERFSDIRGALTHVPDLVAVMDDWAKSEMIGLGFDPDQLVVTGQPAFDVLPALRAGFTVDQRDRIRRGLRVPSGAVLVAFVSQPIAALYGSEPADPSFLGFTEAGVLAELLRSLSQVSKRGLRVVLAILPHPREDPKTFEGASSRDVDVVVSLKESSRQVVMSCDLVVGMNSVLLVEACYLGCPTVSLQPGLRRPDSLPTNRMGITRAVYDSADIDSEVASLLIDDEERRALLQRTTDFRVRGGAAERVAEHVYRLVDDNQGSEQSDASDPIVRPR